MGCLQSKEEPAKRYAAPAHAKGGMPEVQGASSAKQDDTDSVDQLVKDTNFSAGEVHALQELFGHVSNSVVQDSLIHKEEFFRALFDSQEGNLFAERVFKRFDSKKNGVIEFGEFVRGLSVFHPQANMDDKIRFAFYIYDLDETGYISKKEVKNFLFELMKENKQLHFTDEELDSVIEKTFEEVDLAKDNKIHPAEWHTFCVNNPAVINFMTLAVLRDLSARYQ